MHVLNADQFTKEGMGRLFDSADQMRELHENLNTRRGLLSRHAGEQIISLFYEASTRTKASFELGAQKLGMSVYQTENAGEFSSISKGETVEDTIQAMGRWGISAIVMRTKEEGVAARAAAVSSVPIINAGDGKGEHPTQAALDMYTIKREKGQLNNLKVVIGGDLKQGRTARSLSKMLAKFDGISITYVSTPEYQIGKDIKDYLKERNVKFEETVDMYEPLQEADVVYWTRLQAERIEGLKKGERPRSQFVIDSQALEVMNKDAIIMHPLPRVDEIHTSVDADRRAKYFDQVENGLYIRMVMLDNAATLRQNQ